MAFHGICHHQCTGLKSLNLKKFLQLNLWNAIFWSHKAKSYMGLIKTADHLDTVSNQMKMA